MPDELSADERMEIVAAQHDGEGWALKPWFDMLRAWSILPPSTMTNR
ncbi:hypothetical protein [Sphingomonas oligophenolica]|nr:hypothetical protein [Sphingomonas oligophenolica]